MSCKRLKRDDCGKDSVDMDDPFAALSCNDIATFFQEGSNLIHRPTSSDHASPSASAGSGSGQVQEEEANATEDNFFEIDFNSYFQSAEFGKDECDEKNTTTNIHEFTNMHGDEHYFLGGVLARDRPTTLKFKSLALCPGPGESHLKLTDESPKTTSNHAKGQEVHDRKYQPTCRKEGTAGLLTHNRPTHNSNCSDSEADNSMTMYADAFSENNEDLGASPPSEIDKHILDVSSENIQCFEQKDELREV